MNRFKVGDAVVLLTDLPEDGLKRGDVGAVLLTFDQPTVAYETEFCDAEGRTTAQLVLLPDQITRYKEKPSGRRAA